MQTIFEVRKCTVSLVLSSQTVSTSCRSVQTVTLNFLTTESYTPPLRSRAFSIAISRDISDNGYGGVLTIGGVPNTLTTDPTINVTSVSAYTYTPLTNSAVQSRSELSYYAITVDGFTVGSSGSISPTVGNLLNPSAQVVIDSGAPALVLPRTTANNINAAWSPPGFYSGVDYVVPCTATLNATLGVSIGGTVYPIGESSDLLGRVTNQAGLTACISLVTNGDFESGVEGYGLYLLGDPWLRNVLAVFDWENSRFSVYGRTTYQS